MVQFLGLLDGAGIDLRLGYFGFYRADLRRYGGISKTETPCKEIPGKESHAPRHISTQR